MKLQKKALDTLKARASSSSKADSGIQNISDLSSPTLSDKKEIAGYKKGI